ncbi:MAG: hypothetical protein K0S78_731 [Thermomicrobiales bacterium]|nr:hypothetical protein [Thermomicrobiales bacterium]
MGERQRGEIPVENGRHRAWPGNPVGLLEDGAWVGNVTE